jgi:hypothetical protein
MENLNQIKKFLAKRAILKLVKMARKKDILKNSITDEIILDRIEKLVNSEKYNGS